MHVGVNSSGVKEMNNFKKDKSHFHINLRFFDVEELMSLFIYFIKLLYKLIFKHVF